LRTTGGGWMNNNAVAWTSGPCVDGQKKTIDRGGTALIKESRLCIERRRVLLDHGRAGEEAPPFTLHT